MKVVIRVPWKKLKSDLYPEQSKNGKLEIEDKEENIREANHITEIKEEFWNPERDHKLWTWLSMYPQPNSINCKFISK